MRMNLIKKNLQDYDVAEYYENYHFLDERITSRSTKAGEIKKGNHFLFTLEQESVENKLSKLLKGCPKNM